MKTYVIAYRTRTDYGFIHVQAPTKYEHLLATLFKDQVPNDATVFAPHAVDFQGKIAGKVDEHGQAWLKTAQAVERRL